MQWNFQILRASEKREKKILRKKKKEVKIRMMKLREQNKQILCENINGKKIIAK